MIVDIQITMFNLLTIGIVTSENIWHWVWSGVACVYRLTVDELLIPPSGLQSALDDQLVSTVVLCFSNQLRLIRRLLQSVFFVTLFQIKIMFTLVAGVVRDKIYWEKKMFSLMFLSTNCADVIHQLFTVIGGPEMVVEYGVSQ